VSTSRWFENNEFGKVGDNTPKGIIHEMRVEFYGPIKPIGRFFGNK
jgi:hypothetical protein